MNLIYHDIAIDGLTLGECVVRWTGKNDLRWPMLWFCVARETDGVPDTFVVPVNLGGDYIENGPGGRTWSFVKTAPGVWRVSPSINVLVSRDTVAGAHAEQSIWHQTPTVVGVPEPEPWLTGNRD